MGAFNGENVMENNVLKIVDRDIEDDGTTIEIKEFNYDLLPDFIVIDNRNDKSSVTKCKSDFINFIQAYELNISSSYSITDFDFKDMNILEAIEHFLNYRDHDIKLFDESSAEYKKAVEVAEETLNQLQAIAFKEFISIIDDLSAIVDASSIEKAEFDGESLEDEVHAFIKTKLWEIYKSFDGWNRLRLEAYEIEKVANHLYVDVMEDLEIAFSKGA